VGLTNPSSQADLLKVDLWKEKILLYKDAVTAIEGIAPVSVSWAKKHVLGFSDEEIKLDLQQQRIEKAVGAELTNTATIITHTGIFDNIDKLYGNPASGTTAGAPAPAEGGGGGGGSFSSLGGGGSDFGGGPGAPAPEEETVPETFQRDNLKILVERGSMIEEESYIDLSKGKNSLGEIETQLGKLLKD